MSYNIDALRNINFNNLTTLPIGTFVFATSDTSFDNKKKREIFPSDTWIDASEGLVYPCEDWPELAEAKPDWVRENNIVIPDYTGRFPRAKNDLHTIDQIENFTDRAIEGDLTVLRRENKAPGLMNIYLSQISANLNGEYVKVEDRSKLTPLSNENRPNCIALNFFIYASSKRAKLEALKLLELTYPIGSVYTTVIDHTQKDANFKNPSEILGFGTWEMLMEAAGKTLRMVDFSDSNYEKPGMTGGKDSIKLEKSNIPPHSHVFKHFKKQFPGTQVSNTQIPNGKDEGNIIGTDSKTGDTGEGKEFNITNSYYTVIYWVRRG